MKFEFWQIFFEKGLNKNVWEFVYINKLKFFEFFVLYNENF